MWEPAMISVRTGSTRLSNKCLLQLSDTRSVLSHVILRCLEFQLRPIIATTTQREDDVVVDLARNMNVTCFRGDLQDKMSRWLGAARAADIERFVVVDCDDPFFDPQLTRAMYSLAEHNDFVLPDMNVYLGSHGMAVRVDALKTAVERKSSNDTEMVWQHIHAGAHVQQVQVAEVNPIEHGLRLTLDYPEDYWLLRSVMRILGPSCTRPDIVALFEKNPQMRMINEFRNDEWRARQGVK